MNIYNMRQPIEYWSLDNGRVLLKNGDHFPITSWLDATGKETDDGEKVAYVVSGPDMNGKWWNIENATIPWVPIQ